jgi:hypothetical protein
VATTPPTRKERDANLDALQSAVNEWAEKAQTRLENEVQFLRAVQEGRGAKDAATQNLAATLNLVTAEIDSFIVGA